METLFLCSYQLKLHDLLLLKSPLLRKIQSNVFNLQQVLCRELRVYIQIHNLVLHFNLMIQGYKLAWLLFQQGFQNQLLQLLTFHKIFEWVNPNQLKHIDHLKLWCFQSETVLNVLQTNPIIFLFKLKKVCSKTKYQDQRLKLNDLEE